MSWLHINNTLFLEGRYGWVQPDQDHEKGICVEKRLCRNICGSRLWRSWSSLWWVLTLSSVLLPPVRRLPGEETPLQTPEVQTEPHQEDGRRLRPQGLSAPVRISAPVQEGLLSARLQTTASFAGRRRRDGLVVGFLGAKKQIFDRYWAVVL